jgi:hypothetical protein
MRRSSEQGREDGMEIRERGGERREERGERREEREKWEERSRPRETATARWGWGGWERAGGKKRIESGGNKCGGRREAWLMKERERGGGERDWQVGVWVGHLNRATAMVSEGEEGERLKLGGL